MPNKNRNAVSRVPETITLDEANKIMALLNETKNTRVGQVKAVRNRALFLLMLDAGLRIGEVVGLKANSLWLLDQAVDSVNLDPDFAEKGCVRTIPLTPRLKSAIIELHDSYWPFYRIDGTSPAFCGKNKTDSIGQRQIQRIIKAVSLQAIGREIWPHVLRHTFASRLMRTSPVSVVQRLLGHKQISSTQVYMHPNGDDLASAIKSLT